MKGNFVKTSIASNPIPVNVIVAPPTIKKVVQWLTVRYSEGAIVSYPMFPAAEGLAWPRDARDSSARRYDNCHNPCTEQFFVLKTNGQLDMVSGYSIGCVG
jgi:hypothetical protein